MLATTLRLLASLAVVVGLMMLLARFAGRRMRGSHGSLVEVLHRQPLTRASGVAVVTVGGRILVLGTTEHQVNLLTELDPEEIAPGSFADLDTLAQPTPAEDGPSEWPAPAPVHAPDEPDGHRLPGLVAHVPVDHRPFDGAGIGADLVEPTPEDGMDVASASPALGTAAGVLLRRRAPRRPAHRPDAQGSALSGSILAAETWRQAIAAVSGRSS